LKKGLAVGIILFFIAISILPSSGQPREQTSSSIVGGTTLYVGGSGPGNYTTIQDAINHANDGDTIWVYNKTYYEHITVDKQLDILGIPSPSGVIPCIDGGDAIVVSITADHCIFDRFQIGSDWDFGILLQSNDSIIRNCTVFKADSDIKLDGASHNLISHNIFRGSKEGILVDSSSYNTITNNIVDHNQLTKLSLWGGSSYNLVRDNIFSNSTYWEGINNLDNCSYNIYENNIIWNNTEAGINIGAGYDLRITGNSFMNNGIAFSSTMPELLSYTIENNTINGKQLYFYKNANNVTVPSDAGQVILVQCSNFKVQNLTIAHANTGFHYMGGGICLINSTHTTIQGSNISFCRPVGIYLVSSDDNTISSNFLSNNYGGIYCGHSEGNIISDNRIEQGDDHGIELFHASGTTIKGNTVSHYPQCIDLSSSNSITLDGNIITNRLIIDGLSTWSTSNQVIHNRIQGGVTMRGCRFLTFKYNDVSEGGLDLSGCNRNHFVSNNITHSEIGVLLYDCLLNTFKRNNFIANNVSAYFEGEFLFGIFPEFWWRNYWDDWQGGGPKRIEGKIFIPQYSPDWEHPLPPKIVQWRNYDLFPARTPYIIPAS
jgi:parallel beta-helix repeat protein